MRPGIQRDQHKAVKYREFLYLAWELSDAPELTDEVLRGLMREAAQEMRAAGYRPSAVPPAKARLWLEDPDNWSPFVDETAIERALAFDWPVIRNLTRLEMTELVERLAQEDDPFGIDESRRGNPDTAETDETVVSLRRHSFERGTPRERALLIQRVGKVRRRHE